MQQASGIEQINRAILQLDRATQQNAALVEQTAAASRTMGDQATNLHQMMGFFKLEETRQVAVADTSPQRQQNIRQSGTVPDSVGLRRASTSAYRQALPKASAKGGLRAVSEKASRVVGGEDWEGF